MNWQGAVDRTVTGLGYALVDAEKGAGGLLRVFIDHPAAAGDDSAASSRFITVDDCEKVTRQLQHVLEVEGCDYERLEVSSPGLDRPLKTPADYARFVGEQIELTLRLPFQGRKKFRGVLQSLGDAWRLVLDDDATARPVRAVVRARVAGAAQAAGPQALDFSHDEVREARLVPVVDFKGRRSLAAAPVDSLPVADSRPDAVDGGRIQ